MGRTSLALCAAGAFVLAACGDPDGPYPAAETFVLRTIKGEPLPAVFQQSPSTTIELLADTLFLDGEGRGLERALRRVTDAGGTRSYTTESPFSVEVVEGRIQIAFDCQDFASCVAPPHFVGYETDMGITFDESLGAAPLVFERIER